MIRRSKPIVEKEIKKSSSLSEELVEELVSIREDEFIDVEYEERELSPNAPGRFREYMVEEIYKLARFGHTNEEIRTFLGVSKYHWIKGMKLYPEIQKALYSGREEDGMRLVDSLHKQALGYEIEEVQKEYYIDKSGVKKLKAEKKVIKHILPSTKAAMYLLKVRFPNKWSETTRTENHNVVDVNVKHQVDLSDLSIEELMLMKKLNIKQLPEQFDMPAVQALQTIRIPKEDVA